MRRTVGLLHALEEFLFAIFLLGTVFALGLAVLAGTLLSLIAVVLAVLTILHEEHLLSPA